MSLVYCVTAATLVGPKRWLPTEPFDYVWGPFGCNQLRCGTCEQAVRSSIPDGKRVRRYECKCQSRDEYDLLLLGSDAGQLQEFVNAWHCGGHPQLALPTTLEGIAISAVGPFAVIVAQTLATPPFIAPGFNTPSFWVQRLYRLLPTAAQQAMVGQAVAALLSSRDARVAKAAMEFFRDIPRAPGADQVAVLAGRDRSRLRATPDPHIPDASLHDRSLEAVAGRLSVLPGAPVDHAALDIARRALLAGEATDDVIFGVAANDPSWFATHAADIVRARPEQLDFVVEALEDLPAAPRAQAFRNVSAISETAKASVDSALEELAES